MPHWYNVYTPRTNGTIAIDEKWVKVRKKWYYVFLAVETESLDLLHINIYPSRCANSAKAFLGELKAIGFSFDVIITDGCDSYLEPIKKVFPDAEHIHCVLHMGHSKKNALMKVFGSYKHKTYKKLAPYIRRIYKSRNEETFERYWEEFIKEAIKYPELDHYVATMVDQKNYIRQRVIDEGNPRTTNSVERTIKEFQRKYMKMETFNSFYFAKAWCQLFQVYYRLTVRGRGRYKGQSTASVMGYDVYGLSWTDFVLPSESILQ